MREIDEMSTEGFWRRREEKMQVEAKTAAEYANSPLGRKEAARKLSNFLSHEAMDRKLTERENQQLAEARKLLGII